MTSKLIPLALNELLGRRLIESFNMQFGFALLRHTYLDCLMNAKRPNARINPPPDVSDKSN
jgi:hypothetical protein